MIKSSQRGFTLIELVVVIVILGILAAFAVPKFMGLETEARVSAIKSMAGTLRSASSMAHALCMAQSCGASGSVTVDNKPITMANMYPNGATVEQLLQSVDGFTISYPSATRTRFTKNGARGANCWVEYRSATAALAPQIAYSAGVAGTAAETAIDTALRGSC